MPRRRTLVLLTCGALMTCSEGLRCGVQVGVGGANTLFSISPRAHARQDIVHSSHRHQHARATLARARLGTSL